MMLAIRTTSSETSSVMMVMTTRISTRVKPFFFWFIAPPTMRLLPPVRSALLVPHAPRGLRRRARGRIVAAGAPEIEAAGMKHRGGPGGAAGTAARTAAGARAGAGRAVVPVIDEARDGITVVAE